MSTILSAPLRKLLTHWEYPLVAIAVLAVVFWLTTHARNVKHKTCDTILVRCSCVNGLCRCGPDGTTCNDECYAEAVRKGWVK